MHSCDESLFLALNFDGGPCLDRIMTLISGMAIWIPFYLLILWLVCRRYGWRNTLLFLAALALALVLADMICGIFKHSGPLKHLWADFPPRWRPMFSPALEGLDIPADSLFAWRHAGLPTPNSLVHVPAGAVAGKYGTVSSHAATIAALASAPADAAISPCSFENVGRRFRSRAASTITDAARRAARTATASTGSPIIGTSGIAVSRRPGRFPGALRRF